MNLKEELRSDLLTFGRVIMPKAFWAPPAEPHFDIEKLYLDETKKRVNIRIPRALAKSTIVAEVIPIHHILYNDAEQPRLIVILSKTQSHAVDRLQSIKDVFDYSIPFRQIYGYWGEQNPGTLRWTKNDIILKDGSRIVARGTGQPIRGIKQGSVRPTFIIGDDLEDENNTKTTESMKINLDWLLQGADYALDPRYGRIWVIGTPLHPRCIVESLAEYNDWSSIKYSYLNETEDGRKYSLWPEVLSVEELLIEKRDKEEQGKLYQWYMERQCEMRGEETMLFPPPYKYWEGEVIVEKKEAWLSITKKGDEVFNPPKEVPVCLFGGVDPASSIKARADYSVIFTIAVDEEKNIYCVEYYRKRVTPLTLAEAILNSYERYWHQNMRIESTAYQEMLREYMESEFEKRGYYISGLQIKETPRQNKSVRFEGLQPAFARGKVFLKSNMTAFEDELMTCARPRHDDLLDGYWLAQKNCYIPVHGLREKAKEDEDDEPMLKRRVSRESWLTV